MRRWATQTHITAQVENPTDVGQEVRVNMLLRRLVNGLLLLCVFAWLAVPGLARASEYHGQVTFSGLPLPGTTVTVTATQGDKKAVATTDDQGLFTFANLADGTWTVTLEMTGFETLKQDVAIVPK